MTVKHAKIRARVAAKNSRVGERFISSKGIPGIIHSVPRAGGMAICLAW